MLERDFVEYRSLSELMYMKAKTYLKQHPPHPAEKRKIKGV